MSQLLSRRDAKLQREGIGMRKKRVLAWMLIASLMIADSSAVYAAEIEETAETEQITITDEAGELEEEAPDEEEIIEEQETIMEDVCEDEQKIPEQSDEGDMEGFQVAEQTENASVSETLVFGDYEYSINNNLKTATITKYTGKDTILNVPEEINGYRVETIGYAVFEYCSGLTKISLPKGITSIGIRAFAGCHDLIEINLPEGLTSIGDYAFQSCSSLSEIRFPESVTSISNGVFQYCSNLHEISLPEGVTSIGDYVFEYCSGLTKISLPKGITSIGIRAFAGCHDLIEINLPEGLTSIGDYAFQSCSSLSEIRFPESVTSISDGVFQYCSNLQEISLPEGVTSIGNYVFQCCNSLSEISLPKDLTSIGNAAFNSCISLKEIKLPENVTSIKEGAFYCCNSLSEIGLPEGITCIEKYTFKGCDSLREISLPEGVTSIKEGAFSGCSSLSEIRFPEGVTSIEKYAFSGCSNLTEIKFKGNAPRIAYAFPAVGATVYYPYKNSTWTDEVKQNGYGGYLTWKPWFPDEQKTTVSIAGKEEHYLSGQTNYETLSELEKIDNGYSVLKGSTWNVTKTVDLSGGALYIRSNATVKVTGNLGAGEIIIEKGGTLYIGSGGKVTAGTVTAKGGWFGDSWFGGNDSSGGKVEVSGGLLIADNIRFEGRSTLHINNSGKTVARASLCMETSSNESSLEKGYVFIGGNLAVKNKNYSASSANFGTVFYGNETAGVLNKKGKDFALGMVYVTNSDTFTNMELESKNYAGAAKCRVLTNTWGITVISPIANADTSLTWASNVESAFAKINAQSAFACANPQLTKEEQRFVEELAAVWVTVLQAPICEGLLEVKSDECVLEFQLDRGKKKCVLTLTGLNAGGYGKLASVSLNVNDSGATVIGTVANASIDEFSKKAQEYLKESMKKEFIGYASGQAAGILNSKLKLNKDIVKKFISKITEKVCVNGQIFNQTSTGGISDLKKGFKITNMLIKAASKSTASYDSAGLSQEMQAVQESEATARDIPDEAVLSAVSDTVTDEWLRLRLTEVLGADENGELNLANAGSITTLDLSEGYIQKLDGLQYFTNLKELNIADNEVQDLSPIANLTKLEKLNVSGQFISSLYPISNLKNLTVLDVSENELTTLSSVVNLTALKELNASDNRLTTLNSISGLTGLEKASLSDNPLSEGNLNTLKNLNRLSVLEANKCGLNSIAGLPVENLTELYLSDNNIDSIGTLSGAKKLSVLDISYNLLNSVEELSGISTLTQLDVGRNTLNSCAGLQGLTNLVSLYLSQTGIVDNDLEALANLNKLEMLDISDNLIFGLGWKDGLSVLKKADVSNTALDSVDINQLKEMGITVINNSAPIILKSISFMNQEVTLKSGNRYQQTVFCYPTGASLDDLVWKSSNTAIAVVDAEGVVTAVSAGDATITAAMSGGELSSSFTVHVENSTKGDINADGKITMADLMMCLHHVSGRAALTGDEFSAADIDGDGKITMADLMKLLHYVSGRSIELK